MNKINTTNTGGHPLTLEDIAWMQDGTQDAIKGLGSFLGNNIIISGCAFASQGGSVFKVTVGYYMLNGMMCRMEESAVFDITTHPWLYVEPILSHHPDGFKFFPGAGISKDAYDIINCKVFAYTTAQTGKQVFDFNNTASAAVNGLITDRPHNFTARQSFAQDAEVALAANTNYIPRPSSDGGNSFNVNINSYNTPMQRFNGPYPDGTWLAIHFVATNILQAFGAVIADGSAYASGITTAHGKSYYFQTGEVALFIWMNGKARLVNGNKEYDTWHQVGAVGEIGYAPNWTGVGGYEARYTKKDNIVWIDASCTCSNYTFNVYGRAFVLPIEYRPTRMYRFQFNSGDGEPVLYYVMPNGDVQFIKSSHPDNTSLSVFAPLISFPIN